MPIPNRPLFASPDPRWRIRITDDNSPTLVQASTDDSMHSGCGAVAETDHVYLRGSGIAQRLASGTASRVLELGFGSGLAWLLTADAALASAAPLFYLGLENRLPPAAVVRALDLGRFMRRRDLLQQYCLWLESAATSAQGGEASTSITFEYQSLSLQIELGDAALWCHSSACTRYYRPGCQRFDAIYFDPYSPESVPRLWQLDIFTAMRDLLSDDGALVSYCVSRPVRDTLHRAGLAVSKLPGPVGGKREVLRAKKHAPAALPESSALR